MIEFWLEERRSGVREGRVEIYREGRWGGGGGGEYGIRKFYSIRP